MNKVILIGKITKKGIDFSKTKSDKDMARFALAVRKDMKNEKGETEYDFFDCTAWQSTAVYLNTYAAAGSRVAVEGTISLRKYTDNAGVEKQAVDILVRGVDILSEKQRPSEEEQPKKAQVKITLDTDDSDIPF